MKLCWMLLWVESWIPGMKCKVSTWEDKSIRKAKWNVGWFGLWNEKATYAVRCWGGWNELNAMEWRVDGGEVRTASPETEWEKWMNLPQAHGNKTRRIFFTATIEREEGKSVVFGQRSGAMRWVCAAIIHNKVIFIPYLSPKAGDRI
jgi:hypothetical protein